MIQKIFFAIFIIFVVLIGYGFSLPDELNLERTISIEQPPEMIFPYVADLQNFNSWSPWYAKDPLAKFSFSEKTTGDKAYMKWESNHSEVGNGKMEILSQKFPRWVIYQLTFEGEQNANSYFQVEPYLIEDEENTRIGSKVKWGFETAFGQNPFKRYYGLMMKKWLRKEYDEGLTALKYLLENE